MHISFLCVTCGAVKAAIDSMLRRLVHAVQHNHYSAAAVRGVHTSATRKSAHDAPGNARGAAEQETQSILPDVMPATDEGGGPSMSEEELKQMKNKAVMSWLPFVGCIMMSCKLHQEMQKEEQMGRDRMEVAKLLQRHTVIVKGGPQEGRKFLDALVEWKQGGQKHGGKS